MIGVSFFFLAMGKVLTRRDSFYMAIILTILIIGIAYDSNWTRFYQLNAQGENIYLSYFFPERIVLIKRTDIKQLKAANAYKGLRYLIILTSNEKKYRSANMYRIDFQKQFERLKNIL